MLAINKNSVYVVTTPFIPITLNGTGDLTAALFTHFYLKFNNNIEKSLAETVSRVYSIIEETHLANSRELVLVKAQNYLIKPKYSFNVHKID